MELAKFRIHGHRLVRDSQWLQTVAGLNVLDAADIEASRGVLRALQAVNPPYDLDQVRPFQNFPPYEHRAAYTRWVIPAKKTAAIAIFNADPAMVEMLVKYDDSFYEVDRIEVGRRRDYSRWMNFIEMVNSARWSDIAPMVHTLVGMLDAACPPARREALLGLLRERKATDRLRAELGLQVTADLRALEPWLQQEGQRVLADAVERAELAQRFSLAKEEVARQLPPLLLLTTDGDLPVAMGEAPITHSHPATAALAMLFDKITAEDEARRLATSLSREAAERGRASGFHPDFILDSAGRLAVQLGGVDLPLLPPADRLETMAAAFHILYRRLGQRPPIFLLEDHGDRLEENDRQNLLQTLLRIAAIGQCIVAPGSALLHLLRHAGDHAPVNLIPCTAWQPVP